MSAADAYSYATSCSKDDTSTTFLQKDWQFMTDMNNKNYGTKQVVFDLSGFYNSQRFMDLKEMYLEIPIVTTISPLQTNIDPHLPAAAATYSGFSGDSGAAANTYSQVCDDMMGFKSGYWNLIQSISVNIDGKDEIQLTPNLNYYVNFKQLTSFSESDVVKHGPMLGFDPDSSRSWTRETATAGGYSKFGVGFCNNATSQGSGHTESSSQDRLIEPNHAFVRRCKKISNRFHENDDNINAGKIGTGSRCVSSANSLKSQLKDVVKHGADDRSGNAARYWHTTAIIRLKDICDLFSKLPLTRCLYIRLMVTLNTGSLSVGEQQVGRLGSAESVVAENFSFGAAAAAIGALDGTKRGQVPMHASRHYAFNDVLQKTSAWGPVFNSSFDGTCPVMLGQMNQYPQDELDRNVANAVLNPGSTLIGHAAALSFPVLVPVVGVGIEAMAVNANANNAANVAATRVLVQAAFGVGGNAGVIDMLTLLSTEVNRLRVTVSGAAPVIGATSDVPISTLIREEALKAVKLAEAQRKAEEVLKTVGCTSGLSSTIARGGFKLSVEVGKSNTTHGPVVSNHQNASHQESACRIYAPAIEMEPSKALSYLQNFRDQPVVYNDLISFFLLGQGPGVSFNFQMANGVSNAKRLIIIPFYRTRDNNVVNSDAAYVPFQPSSPFDSSPATTAPGAHISNFNILLSNQNMFPRNIEYGFEHFISEISECNAINGGLDTGLTSGLIDYDMWQNNYHYYIVDLSRRLNGDSTPKSITMIGKNDTLFDVDYYIFCEYERQFSLNVETGHISH